jgi:hypothetical protein
MSVHVPAGADAQWSYKANVATSKSATGRGWDRFRSSNGWPKVPPRLVKLLGAECLSVHTGRCGRVVRANQCGWLVVESPDGEVWTSAPGGLVIDQVPAGRRPRAVSAKDQQLAQLRERVRLLEADNARLRKLLGEKGRRASVPAAEPEQTALAV